MFVRDCLYSCLNRLYPDREIVAFGSLSEWIKSTEKALQRPAVVLYSAPTVMGLKSEFERLEALVPGSPIIVLSDAASSDEIARIIGYGARGYIPTTMPFHLAVEAVRFVEAGGTFVPATNLVGGHDRYKQPGGACALTEQQLKVVEGVSLGYGNKQIAHKLKMSENTVKVHLRRIIKKLNARNRTEIAIMTLALLHRSH